MVTSPAAGHALDVLTLLARNAEPLRASAIALELGLPRSTTYRLLSTLAVRGFVSNPPGSGGYALGATAYELGFAYQRQQPLQRAARRFILGLVERTRENAQLAVLQGKDSMYVLEERAPGRPSLVSAVGVRLPAELTASGLAMLAHLSSKQVSALYPHAAVLTRRTEFGPTTVADLRRTLGEVRRQGYSSEQGTVTEGLSSIAVPLLDSDGRPLAAIALTFAEGQDATGFRPALETAAAGIRGRLGYR